MGQTLTSVNQTTLDAAARMGARAGALWRDYAIPRRNPFAGNPKLVSLATAWAAAYLDALLPVGSPWGGQFARCTAAGT